MKYALETKFCFCHYYHIAGTNLICNIEKISKGAYENKERNRVRKILSYLVSGILWSTHGTIGIHNLQTSLVSMNTVKLRTDYLDNAVCKHETF